MNFAFFASVAMAYRPQMWRPTFAGALPAPPVVLPILGAAALDTSLDRSRSPRGEAALDLSLELSRIIDVNMEAEVQVAEVESQLAASYRRELATAEGNHVESLRAELETTREQAERLASRCKSETSVAEETLQEEFRRAAAALRRESESEVGGQRERLSEELVEYQSLCAAEMQQQARARAEMSQQFEQRAESELRDWHCFFLWQRTLMVFSHELVCFVRRLEHHTFELAPLLGVHLNRA